eukprot:scaffold19300_cov32-Attheya_sp.AAC.2
MVSDAGTLGGRCRGVTCLKISARSVRAFCWAWFKAAKGAAGAHALRSWLNDPVYLNINDIIVTLETFHALRFWWNTKAEWNIYSMFRTLETSQSFPVELER